MNRYARALAPLLSITILLSTLITVSASGSKTIVAKFPTTSAMKLVDSDPSITSVLVVNNGSVTVYLGNSSSVTAAASASTDGIPLYVNNYIVFNDVTDALYGITSSGTGNLRITTTKGGGRIESGRLQTSGISNGAAANTIPMSNGSDLVASNALVYNLSTAITPNSTTTSTAAGTLAMTSNATGRGSIFRSDGTNWQLLSNYSDGAFQSESATIATTGNTDTYVIAPYAATVTGVDFSGVDALSASDTNYITFSITNLGQAGSGSNPILAATAANTTQATGGTAISANTKRSLTLNGTGSNLVVAAGDRLRVRYAVTGTLGNTVTYAKIIIRFTRLS